LFAIIIFLLPVYGFSDTATPAPAEALQGLRLIGKGKFSYFSLHIYDAALYATSKDFNTQQLTEVRYALALHYARDLQGHKIAERSEQEMARGEVATQEERLLWLQQMKTLFPDVKKGDVLIGLHTPQKGTRFFHNSKLLGEVSDPRFAQAFFGIWLSEKTSAPRLREALLKPPQE
jgi:hypothetical protein